MMMQLSSGLLRAPLRFGRQKTGRLNPAYPAARQQQHIWQRIPPPDSIYPFIRISPSAAVNNHRDHGKTRKFRNFIASCTPIFNQQIDPSSNIQKFHTTVILPIVAFGSPILRKVASDITPDYPGLEKLMADMWETMYNSNGVGLAAPQINKDVRIFVMDSVQIFQNLEEDNEKHDYPDAPGYKGIFINAHIVSLEGKEWAYNEGCLSIPKIREDVMRKETVTLTYQDETFATHTRTFNGITARVILHEYDHLDGKLFIDYLAPLKRRLMKRKLEDITKGKTRMDYRMITVK